MGDSKTFKEMMSSRQFWHGTLGLVAFVFILIYSQFPIDPLALGVGVGLALTPAAASIGVEHLAKKGK